MKAGRAQHPCAEVGAGALGSYYSARLALAGADGRFLVWNIPFNGHASR